MKRPTGGGCIQLLLAQSASKFASDTAVPCSWSRLKTPQSWTSLSRLNSPSMQHTILLVPRSPLSNRSDAMTRVNIRAPIQETVAIFFPVFLFFFDLGRFAVRSYPLGVYHSTVTQAYSSRVCPQPHTARMMECPVPSCPTCRRSRLSFREKQ